jgi:hypothetical protein
MKILKTLIMKIQKMLIESRLNQFGRVSIDEMTTETGEYRQSLLEKKMQIGLQIQSVNNAKSLK